MKRFLSTALLASAIAVAAMPVSAQEILKATWTDPDDPTTSPIAAYMHVMRDQLKRLAGDDFTLELYPNGQLGDQRSMVQQVSRGSLQMANVASGVLASLYYPELGIVDLPFLFKNKSHFNASMHRDNPFIKTIFDDLAADTGIRVISLHPYGFRNMTTKDHSVCAPENIKGLRIRTMEVVPHQRMMEALGATPVPIPYLELYTSLQTGVVDGQENPPSNILMKRFYEVQGYMAETQHVMTTGALIVNEKWWQSLSDDQRKAFLAAHDEASLAHDGIGAIQDLLGVQKIRDQGVEVCTPTPDQMNTFRSATIEPTKAWAVDQFGAEFVNGFVEHMASFD